MGSFEMHRFRAVDRPLTQKEMQEIDKWSSRFSPTSTGITYIYHYGSFKQDEFYAVSNYFDAMLHINNWGQVQLMFRFQKKLVDWKELKKYSIVTDECHLDFKKTGDFVVMILELNDEEGGDWVEENDFLLDPLLSIRDEIMNGDYRALFMGWVMVRQRMILPTDENFDEELLDYLDEDEDFERYQKTPPVPSALNKLNAGHKELIQSFQINEDIIKAASKFSTKPSNQKSNYGELIAKLPQSEKDELLLKLVSGEKRLEIFLKKRLETMIPKAQKTNLDNVVLWDKLIK